jgi:erythromycin esterase
MKNYNIGKSDQQKVHLLGVDCQYFDTNARLILEKTSQILPTLGEQLIPILRPLKDRNFNPKLADLDLALSLIQSKRSEIVKNSSSNEYDIIEHLVTILIQTYGLIGLGDIEYLKLRDEFMGKNTIWLSARTDYPLSVWAHNYHVSTPIDAFSNRTMGFYIKNGLQGNYKVIGFSFTQGTVTAIDKPMGIPQTYTIPDELKKSFSNKLLGESQYVNYLYKTNEVFKNAKVRQYFVSKPFYQMGAGFNGTPAPSLADYPAFTDANYDYMIHFTTSSHSGML